MLAKTRFSIIFKTNMKLSSFTFLCGVVVICAAPQQPTHNNTINPSDIVEAQKLKLLLDASHLSSSPKPPSSSTSASSSSKPDISTGHLPKEDSDYSFHSDRLPVLSDDEFNNLTADANPLHFLKQLPEPTKPQNPLPTQASNVDAAPPPVPSSPIYITIPIYISTAGKQPLTLTIGDQEVSLHQLRQVPSYKKKDHHQVTRSPNSHFNRLLEAIEPPKRRTTNRHRSPSRSKIQALKERQLNRDQVQV